MSLKTRIAQAFPDDSEIAFSRQDIYDFVSAEKRKSVKKVVAYIKIISYRIKDKALLNFIQKLVTLIEDRFNLDE